MNKLAVAVAVSVATFVARPVLAADEAPPSRVRLAPFVGAYLPVGQLRHELEDAPLVGVTVTFDLAPSIAAVGTLGWSPTRLKRVSDGEVDLLQYDAGLQVQRAFELGGGIAVEPFAGAGVGLRTFLPRHVGAGETYYGAWYTGAGVAARRGAGVVSVAARHYASNFEVPALALESVPRRELALAASIGYRF